MRWHPTLEEIAEMAGLSVLPPLLGGEGNTNQEPFAKTGCEDGGISPQPSPQRKTDLEKLAHIFTALCACDRAFREIGAEYTEIDGVPIKDWIADAKSNFA